MATIGGAANSELAEACASVADLKAQYKSVIDTYALTQLDFDIEGAAITKVAANTRRAQAIAQLQSEAAGAGKSLKVSYTLPVLPQGLTQDGVNLVKNALANGVNIAVVNIMAMDYGGSAAPNPANRMGEYAIEAATNLFNQLKAIYLERGEAKSDAALWAMVGVTPMIGQNDVLSEVFNQEDARQVLAFAQEKSIARLSMWSSNRDRACTLGSGALYECTQIAQTPNEFSLIFNTFASGSPPPTPGPTFTPSPTSPPSAPTPPPTASPPPSPSSGCVVIYKLTNEWSSGFNADVIIRNYTGTTINGWTLTWRFPTAQTITSSWNGKFTQSGADVTVKNEAWNADIPINGSTSVGFGATGVGSTSAPSEFRLNGALCNQGLPANLSPRVFAPVMSR